MSLSVEFECSPRVYVGFLQQFLPQSKQIQTLNCLFLFFFVFFFFYGVLWIALAVPSRTVWFWPVTVHLYLTPLVAHKSRNRSSGDGDKKEHHINLCMHSANVKVSQFIQRGQSHKAKCFGPDLAPHCHPVHTFGGHAPLCRIRATSKPQQYPLPNLFCTICTHICFGIIGPHLLFYKKATNATFITWSGHTSVCCLTLMINQESNLQPPWGGVKSSTQSGPHVGTENNRLQVCVYLSTLVWK